MSVSCGRSGSSFFGLLTYTTVLSANNNTLSSSFLVCPHDLLQLSIALAKNSSTILSRYGENGQPCLVSDFSAIALSFPLFNLILSIGLLLIASIMFRYVPCIPYLFRTFIMKGWICQRHFLYV